MSVLSFAPLSHYELQCFDWVRAIVVFRLIKNGLVARIDATFGVQHSDEPCKQEAQIRRRLTLLRHSFKEKLELRVRAFDIARNQETDGGEQDGDQATEGTKQDVRHCCLIHGQTPKLLRNSSLMRTPLAP